MAEKSIKARVIQKHDTEENWLKATNFIPKQGELIIYDIDSTHDIERFKIGDGTTTVNKLPFQATMSNSKSGSAILIDDVSSVTHNMSVKVRSKNILPYPYAETTKIESGITITDSGDGSISLSGTSTAQANFYFSQNLQLKKGITYTLSASGNYSFGGTASFYIYNSTYGSLAYINLNADNSYTFTPTKDINGINCYIVIPSDRTVSGIFKPQLELGTTATAYTPYVPDLTAVKVIKSNASGEAVAEYIPNADGTVNGVTSLYPNTTLMTDTEGVIIDCEYLTKSYTGIAGSTNLRNGSSIGSTRSIGSKKEDSSYKLGNYAMAEGQGTAASGIASHAEGSGTTASGYQSHSEGDHTTASGDNSHAEGLSTTASGYQSHTEGDHTTASGYFSHAEGYYTIASGSNSHTEGDHTTASGENSHAEGWYTKASGNQSHAEGYYTTASEHQSHAEGYYTTASGRFSHVEGYNYTTAKGLGSHAEGNHTIASGENSHSEGSSTVASAYQSHAEGDHTTASGSNSHAEGISTKASGDNSHVEGHGTTASGENSHAEGWYTKALSYQSHVEGSYTTASGNNSHVEGSYTTASSDNAHAEGLGTTASSNYQHVQGKCNIADTANIYADIIGNGSSDTKRSNASTVDWQGNGWFSGEVYVGSTSGTNKDEGSKKLATEEYVNSAISSSGGSGIVVDSELSSTSVNPVQNKVINTALSNKVDKVSGKGLSTNDYTSAEKTKLSGIESGANKTIVDTALSDTSENPVQNKVIDTALSNKMDKTNPTGTGSFSLNRKLNTTIGSYSHAEGNSTTASHFASHAEGGETTASDVASHAEGLYTIASSPASHAEGSDTIASSSYQHVQGQYNIEDSLTTYADIIGNGSSNTKRSNAATVDWKGNAWYAGAVTSKAADYAEFFEWLDGNPNNEDRVGYLVALDGEKIRFANPEDEILGIISANPAILGDNYECDWNGKYLTDEFGRILYDKVEEFIDIPKVDEETGEITTEKKSLGFFDRPRINPDYDPDQEYINRRNRSEWAMVGMLGKLFVRDDGTAQINGYVSAGEGGIATASTEKTNMRVLSRVNDHIIKVLLK